jgi:hypothetical protein
MAEPTSPFCELRTFRAELHACLTRRADALFDLCDALLCAEVIPSLAHLSLQPPHQRGWGSTDAALAHGRVDLQALRNLLAHHPLHDGEPIYAVDVSTWPRCDAETSPERGFSYHPSRPSAGQPIVAGWAFQWICQLSWPGTAGPLRSTRPGCTRSTTTTRPPSARSAPSSTARPLATRRCPCVCSTPATTPAHSASAWPRCPPRSWSGLRSGRCFYADPPPRAPAGKAADRAATGPSSTPPTRPAGRSRPLATPKTTATTAP